MVIDFHSHILPGIDDGSASVKESIAMLQMETAQGVKHVIATPHFYAHHDSPERFLRRRNEAEARLRADMSRYEGLPKVSVGAEVYFFHGISESDIISELAIAGGKYILIEMPHAPWTESMYRELEGIYTKHRVTPIIAHVDRYISPFRTHRIPERLEQLPVFVQANAEFFLRGSTRAMALRMLRENRIQLLGSDCHNLSDRAPNLGAAIELIRRRCGDGRIKQINSYEDEILLGSSDV